jgi:hypothetical protein
MHHADITHMGDTTRRFTTALIALVGLLCAAPVPAAVAATSITLGRVETAAAPGVAITAYTLPETAPGGSGTSTDSFRAAAVTQTNPKSVWSVQASLTTATLTQSATGVTMPAASILAEGAPTTGTYQALGTTYVTLQSSLAATASSSGFFHLRVAPPASQDSGTYTGTLQVRVSNAGGKTSVVSIPLTVLVTATLAVAAVNDAGGSSVSSAAFAQTPPGAVSSPIGPYDVALAAAPSGQWELSAQITVPFTKAATGDTLPASAILVNGPAQSGSYVPLSASVVLQNAVPRATVASGPVLLEFAPPTSQDSGDYSGVVTFTAGTL